MPACQLTTKAEYPVWQITPTQERGRGSEERQRERGQCSGSQTGNALASGQTHATFPGNVPVVARFLEVAWEVGCTVHERDKTTCVASAVGWTWKG